jgi:hypothetical protein
LIITLRRPPLVGRQKQFAGFFFREAILAAENLKSIDSEGIAHWRCRFI